MTQPIRFIGTDLTNFKSLLPGLSGFSVVSLSSYNLLKTLANDKFAFCFILLVSAKGRVLGLIRLPERLSNESDGFKSRFTVLALCNIFNDVYKGARLYCLSASSLTEKVDASFDVINSLCELSRDVCDFSATSNPKALTVSCYQLIDNSNLFSSINSLHYDLQNPDSDDVQRVLGPISPDADDDGMDEYEKDFQDVVEEVKFLESIQDGMKEQPVRQAPVIILPSNNVLVDQRKGGYHDTTYLETE